MHAPSRNWLEKSKKEANWSIRMTENDRCEQIKRTAKTNGRNVSKKKLDRGQLEMKENLLSQMHINRWEPLFIVAKWMQSIMALKARAGTQPLLQKTNTSHTRNEWSILECIHQGSRYVRRSQSERTYHRHPMI